MGEVQSLHPDMFAFWEARLVECEGGAEIAERNLGRLALIDQLPLFDYADLQDLPSGSRTLREV